MVLNRSYITSEKIKVINCFLLLKCFNHSVLLLLFNHENNIQEKKIVSEKTLYTGKSTTLIGTLHINY